MNCMLSELIPESIHLSGNNKSKLKIFNCYFHRKITIFLPNIGKGKGGVAKALLHFSGKIL